MIAEPGIELGAQVVSAVTAFGLMFGMLHLTVRYVLDTSKFLREEAEHERAARLVAEADLDLCRKKLRESGGM